MRSIYRAQCDCNMAEPQVIQFEHGEDPRTIKRNAFYDVEFYLRCKICGTRYSEERVDEDKE